MSCFAQKVSLGGYLLTVTWIVVECDNAAATSVPVIVMVYVLATVVLATVTVIVEGDPNFTEFGLKAIVMPFGAPEAASVGEPA
jgi:hypothetical protein